MKVLARFPMCLLALVVGFLAVTNADACSCETYGQPRKDAKDYYQKKFDGAIFTGTIKEIKHDPNSDSGGITYSELRIEVDQYWLGPVKEDVVLLVPGPNTSCWLDWKLGKKKFFVASNSNGSSYYSICDVANWGGTYPSSKWSDYTRKILGSAKSFPKGK
jgi:hypothetical protein